jgi:hypothetical protein
LWSYVSPTAQCETIEPTKGKLFIHIFIKTRRKYHFVSEDILIGIKKVQVEKEQTKKGSSLWLIHEVKPAQFHVTS